MLNEQRVILMTRMEAYAQEEGKQNMQIGKYFRDDYLSLQVLQSVGSITIAYLICVGLYILYHLETLMQDVYKMDLFALAGDILIYYGIAVISYGLISYIVYAVRSTRARKNLKHYYNHLKKLNSLYDN